VPIKIPQAHSEQQALDIHEGRADAGLARAPILSCREELHEEPLVPSREALATVQVAPNSYTGLPVCSARLRLCDYHRDQRPAQRRQVSIFALQPMDLRSAATDVRDRQAR
jgi:hypothetical protein